MVLLRVQTLLDHFEYGFVYEHYCFQVQEELPECYALVKFFTRFALHKCWGRSRPVRPALL